MSSQGGPTASAVGPFALSGQVRQALGAPSVEDCRVCLKSAVRANADLASLHHTGRMGLKERMDAAVARQEQQNAARKAARCAELEQAKGRYAEERDEIRARKNEAFAQIDAAAAERAEDRQQAQAEIDQQKAERASWDRKLAKFEGVTLRKRSIERGFADTQPLAGVHASIESGEAVTRRTTATRVVGGAVLAGPVGAVIGAVAKKRTGGELYLVITGPEFEWQIEVDRKHADKARQFAAQVNTAAKQIDAQ